MEDPVLKFNLIYLTISLGDFICPGGGCELATIKRCCSAWAKSTELLPSLTLNTCGHLYNSCVRGMMLYPSECFALRQEDKKSLECGERARLLWMCNIKKEQHVSTNSLLN